MITVIKGKVYIDGIEYAELMPRVAKASLLDTLAANKKAIFGVVGALSGFLSFMSLAVPELTAMFPLASKIILAAVSFAGFGAAHVSKPDTVTPVPVIATPPMPPTAATNLIYGDAVHQGPVAS